MLSPYLPPASFPDTPSEDSSGLASITRETSAAMTIDASGFRKRRRLPRRAILLPLVVSYVVIFVTLGALYVPIPPNSDAEQLGYMGYVVDKGGVLYRDASDTNMPGEPLLHFVSLAAFGNHYWSYRLLDFLLLLAFVAAMGILLSEREGVLTGVLFSLIYPAVYVTAGGWMSGQRDYLAAHAVTVAAFLFLRRIERRGIGWPILSGALIGLGMLLKPTVALMCPLLFAYDFYRTRSFKLLIIDAIALGVGIAAVIGPLVVLGAFTGALQPWYEVTVLYSSRYYVSSGGFVTSTMRLLGYAQLSWRVYFVVALCGITSWFLSRRRKALAATLIVGVTVMGSAVAQNKGFGYHVAGALVVLALLDTYFLMQVIRLGLRVSGRRAKILVLMLPFTLFGLGLVSKCVGTFKMSALWMAGSITEREFFRGSHFDDVVEAARYVARTTTPDQTVWPYTRHLMICTLADRLMPTRFSTAMFLRLPRPSKLADEWREEVKLTMMKRPPELIILERGTEGKKADWETGDVADHEPLKPFLTALKQQYHQEIDIGRFVVFRLNPLGSKRDGLAKSP